MNRVQSFGASHPSLDLKEYDRLQQVSDQKSEKTTIVDHPMLPQAIVIPSMKAPDDHHDHSKHDDPYTKLEV